MDDGHAEGAGVPAPGGAAGPRPAATERTHPDTTVSFEDVLGVGPFPPIYGRRRALIEELRELDQELSGLAGPRPTDDWALARQQVAPVPAGSKGFSTIPQAIEAIRAGQVIIVVDDEDRENEGDFVMAASAVTPEAVNGMITHGRGLLCLSMTGERLDELGIGQMVPEAAGREETAFTVSVDLDIEGSTGISASDRARTILRAVDPAARPEDFRRPGHVFPLRARPRGVLDREGHTEASIDLARLAGLPPAGVICEIMNPDGTMARLPQLLQIAEQFGMHLVTIEDLVAYRRRHEVHVRQVADVALPTDVGDFRAIAFESDLDRIEHVALILGDVRGGEAVPVRLHSECLTGDVFGSQRCDCGPQLQEAMRRVAEHGSGVVLYLRGHEGRGIGLVEKLRAYNLQEDGHDTVEANIELGHAADLRDWDAAAQILNELGVESVRLLTNNPAKVAALEANGIRVEGRDSLEIPPTEHNRRYLETKRTKLGHALELGEPDQD
ncbi:MAG: bifunctional 3,4-dihydroxy-2-butanone-4-phosphate synthase/GTP cyclohydrolase II [Nitriliruptorales bacterium]|nr:bifunctional 3,4-dihydroxy-2-butanone-4-phosphate synthase/GTP cyclohydrolase II [Nitriliruptorales bacterium]